MDKSKALERLAALESEAKALRKIIEAPEVPTSLLTKPEPESGETHWEMFCSPQCGSLTGRSVSAGRASAYHYIHGNIFQTSDLVENYSNAFNTFLLLRHQPGTVPTSNHTQFLIEMWVSCGVPVVEPQARTDEASKMSKISPSFVTEEAAKRAIKTIGKNRLMHMFRTFHHVNYEYEAA